MFWKISPLGIEALSFGIARPPVGPLRPPFASRGAGAGAAGQRRKATPGGEGPLAAGGGHSYTCPQRGPRSAIERRRAIAPMDRTHAQGGALRGACRAGMYACAYARVCVHMCAYVRIHMYI